MTIARHRWRMSQARPELEALKRKLDDRAREEFNRWESTYGHLFSEKERKSFRSDIEYRLFFPKWQDIPKPQ